MSILEKRYIDCLPEIKEEVLRLGFLCWDLIQQESMIKRDIDLEKQKYRFKDTRIVSNHTTI